MKPFGKRFLSAMPMFALGALLFTAGCSDDETTQPPDEFAPPTNLTYINGDGEVSLSWSASPDQTSDDFAGYQIYHATATLVNATTEQLTAAKLNGTLLQANDLDFTATSTNGVKYFYSVRAVKDNGDLSEPTNEIDTASRPGGDTITTLAEFRDKSRNSAMDLSEGVTYSFIGENSEHVDFYLGTTATDEATDQPLALKSPSVVDSNDPVWNTRIAQFKLLDNPDAATTSNTGFSDIITLGATKAEIEGKVIAVKLPPDENDEVHYGKLEVLEFAGTAGERSIRFIWAYQQLPNYIRF